MPTINRQTPAGPAARTATPGSILDRIRPVGSTTTGIKLNVYGMGKTGKTRLACSFPKPILLIGTEDGTKSVATVPGVDFVRVSAGNEFSDLVSYVKEGGLSCWDMRDSQWIEVPGRSGLPYISVGNDTAGGLQDIVLKEVLHLDEIPLSKFRKAGKGEAWGIADKGDWGVVGTQWKERISKLLALAESGINVVVIAHEREFGEEGKRKDGIPYVGSALTPSVANWLNGACDYVVQCFIKQKEVTESMTVGVGKSAVTTTTRKKVKGVDYCLRLTPDDTYMAGFRVPDGIILPDYIVNPTYEKIVAIIKGEEVR